tara:strand:+ start:219 stop:458 length:240 start_codon:yes stop_codon:yes gene_type:complete
MTNFAVYTKTGCPYCTKIKDVLADKGYTFREYQLDKDFSRESFYEEFGEGSTFPQVLLNSEKLGGCVDAVKYMRQNNLI